MSTKQLILLGCLPLLSITGLRAQHSTKSLSPWTLSASMGLSLPVGKFGGNNYYDSSQSLATKGLALNLQIGYRLSAHFGIGVLLTGQDNEMNNLAIEQSIDSSGPNSVTVAKAGYGSWKIMKAIIGPTLSLPVGQGGKWNITARIMAGGLKTASPKTMLATETFASSGSGSLGLGVPGTYVLESYFYQTGKSLSWAFAYLGGAGFDYQIDNRWKFLMNVDYSAASVKVPYLYYRHNFSGANPGGPVLTSGTGPIVFPPVPSTHLSLPVASVNATVGLEFRF